MLINRLLIAGILGPELALWRLCGHAPRFWWRDDDARQPTQALTRLLTLSARRGAPVTLAAVPDGDIAALACHASPEVELAIHGFRHENRAPDGQPSGEVIDADRFEDVLGAVAAARGVFSRAGVAATLFVPPWNNAHPTLREALAVHGLGLSVYGDINGADVHLDVMRWKPRARFRGALRVVLRLLRLLVARRRARAWDAPIGILTHHLDHDEATWQFLDDLLAVFPTSPRSRQDAF